MAAVQNQTGTSTYSRKREKFVKELTTYVICNLFFIAIWFFSGRGNFWPIWVILGWGISIGFSAADFIRFSSKKGNS